MSRFDAVTCLGCGCSCDDIAVTVEGASITSAERACPLGVRWFGDGGASSAARIGSRSVDSTTALAELGQRLSASAGARRTMIYLAAELTVAGQRAAVALADRLHARLDSVSSDSVAGGILAAQRRGRCGATLGELRERVDVAVYWAVDPAERYPRFVERYLPRKGRRVIAVDVGPTRGPADADERLLVEPGQEIDVLSVIRAASGGRPLEQRPGVLARAAEIGKTLASAKYVAIVYDAEPGEQPRDAGRAEGLTALAQGLNTPTRAALCGLRGGGNRVGAEQVMTWQTGYPMCVDFSSGAPGYRPGQPASALVAAGVVDLLVVAGDFRSVPAGVIAGLRPGQIAVIGPGATSAAPADAIAIDTGRAGIHEGGVAFRMDDVTIPLTAVLPGSLTVADALAQLGGIAPGSR